MHRKCLTGKMKIERMNREKKKCGVKLFKTVEKNEQRRTRRTKWRVKKKKNLSCENFYIRMKIEPTARKQTVNKIPIFQSRIIFIAAYFLSAYFFFNFIFLFICVFVCLFDFAVWFFLYLVLGLFVSPVVYCFCFSLCVSVFVWLLDEKFVYFIKFSCDATVFFSLSLSTFLVLFIRSVPSLPMTIHQN